MDSWTPELKEIGQILVLDLELRVCYLCSRSSHVENGIVKSPKPVQIHQGNHGANRDKHS